MFKREKISQTKNPHKKEKKKGKWAEGASHPLRGYAIYPLEN
jgi:hypothetical protein